MEMSILQWKIKFNADDEINGLGIMSCGKNVSNMHNSCILRVHLKAQIERKFCFTYYS